MRKIIVLLIVLALILSGCGKEEFTVEGDPDEQIETIANHYVEETVWNGEITDLQINKDADGEGYVCVLKIDWDQKTDNASGTLQSYADELCNQLSDNGNTSQFTVIFNALQQGGIYKRSYRIDGAPEVIETIDQL